jgi:hypothetical protein
VLVLGANWRRCALLSWPRGPPAACCCCLLPTHPTNHDCPLPLGALSSKGGSPQTEAKDAPCLRVAPCIASTSPLAPGRYTRAEGGVRLGLVSREYCLCFNVEQRPSDPPAPFVTSASRSLRCWLPALPRSHFSSLLHHSRGNE